MSTQAGQQAGLTATERYPPSWQQQHSKQFDVTGGEWISVDVLGAGKGTHPNLNIAANLLFKIHAELQQFPRRRGGNHERNTTFGSGHAFL